MDAFSLPTAEMTIAEQNPLEAAALGNATSADELNSSAIFTPLPSLEPVALTAFDLNTGAIEVTESQRGPLGLGRVRLRDSLTGIPEPVGATLLNGDIVLDFSAATAGSLVDQAGQGTGFTSVLPDQNISQQELYDPERITLDPTAGNLSVTGETPLENALQLPIAATQTFTVSTRLTNIPTTATTDASLGGVFLGTSQDDYVYLALVSTSSGLGLQFFQEQNGAGANVGEDSSSPIVELPDASLDTLDLFLTSDPFTGTIAAAYRLNSNSAAPTSLSQQFNPDQPEAFFADKSTARAGILPTLTADLDPAVAYDSFNLQYAAVEPVSPIGTTNITTQQVEENNQTLQVNFQPEGATVPSGYIADTGEAYDDERGYGWVTQASLDEETPTPIDISPNARDRNAVGDQRLDTLLHMQYPTSIGNPTAVTTPAAWEYSLPNGEYSVTVSVGDQPGGGVYDSQHLLNIEDVEVIPSFQSNSIQEYEIGTATVDVADGRLTIDASGGSNTKINYLEIESVPLGENPSVTGSAPARRQADVNRGAAVNLNVNLVNVGAGVDDSTLTTNNVQLYRTEDNTLVPGNINTTGGGDAIVYQPNSLLDPLTNYTLRVGSGVQDEFGNPFLPFSTTFSTGTAIPNSVDVDFNRTEVFSSAPISSLVISPDGSQLYAAAVDGIIRRWDIDSSGSLSNLQTFDGLAGDDPAGPRAIIGIVFDPDDPNVLWVSHNDTLFVRPANDFTGAVSKLTLDDGTDFAATVEDYVVGLPRSAKDHLSNSLDFGPDGNLYLSQGSNTATGAPDIPWNQRPERLLTAAVLQINPDLTPPAGGFNVQTEDYTNELGESTTGNYDPFTADAPVTIYGTGIRNAYDLIWASNGSLYVPTNGSAPGGNTPDDPDTPINEALNDVPIQNDYLFRVESGGYYGHPNSLRNEYILNGGNPTAGEDPAEVVTQGSNQGYPEGVAPDPNWRGFAYDFGRNRSPNGVIEYQSDTFDGELQNKLLVVEFSGGKDIIALTPDASGDVPPGTAAQVADGFVDPLDLVEDSSTGNVYVAELVDENTGQGRITLLSPA